jgi:hypothetical protein
LQFSFDCKRQLQSSETGNDSSVTFTSLQSSPTVTVASSGVVEKIQDAVVSDGEFVESVDVVPQTVSDMVKSESPPNLPTLNDVSSECFGSLCNSLELTLKQQDPIPSLELNESLPESAGARVALAPVVMDGALFDLQPAALPTVDVSDNTESELLMPNSGQCNFCKPATAEVITLPSAEVSSICMSESELHAL